LQNITTPSSLTAVHPPSWSALYLNQYHDMLFFCICMHAGGCICIFFRGKKIHNLEELEFMANGCNLLEHRIVQADCFSVVRICTFVPVKQVN
jgi:hypothetical protein